jgi:5-methylcytosine-specific restriction endonuclease McrA
MGLYGVPVPKTRSVHDKREAKRAKEKRWQQVRQAVLVRDERRCRVCRSRDAVDVHHVRFRSAGRDDSTRNCATLCRGCHADVHAYRLAIEGDADKTLKVTRF